MNWLVMFFALQGGMITQETSLASRDGLQLLQWRTAPNTMEATFDIRAVAFDHIAVGGFIRSYQAPESLTSFNPFRIDYGVSASLFWGPLSVGVVHECNHQVRRIDERSILDTSLSGGRTECFIRLESKLQF